LLGAAFFLLGLLEKMRTDYSTLFDTEPTSDNGTDERDTDRQRVSGFLDQWGWEYNVDQCSENERIEPDRVYLEWNVIRFMNKLAYLKDKGKFLIALNSGT
jgi:hypothetical protein